MKSLKKIYLAIGVSLCLISCNKDDKDELPQSGNLQNSEIVKTNLQKYAELNTNGRVNLISEIMGVENCFSITYPVSIRHQNKVGEVKNDKDFTILFLAAASGEKIELIYPINVVLENGTKKELKTGKEYKELSDNCKKEVSNNDDSLKNCFSIFYPIKLAKGGGMTMNTINSNEELNSFFSGLKKDELVSVSYPLALALQGPEIRRVSNAKEFELILTSCKSK